jgi:predicted alpha/beta-hydrolase family hydrolase
VSEARIGTPHGEGRLVTRRARKTAATVLLSHGAGNGIDTADLEALTDALPAEGFTVVRFEQPWRVAGRPVAGPPATLDAGLRAAADWMRVRSPLVIGGRSAGARSAVRMARSLGAVGALALAFPLHPPGKPERSRAPELAGAAVPTLVVQGERDAFGRPDEFPELTHVDLAVVPAADHSFKVGKTAPVTPEMALAVLVEATLEWLVREAVG